MSDEFGRAKEYARSLDEIWRRLGVARELQNLKRPSSNAESTQETAALNLRKCLELVAFGALSANKSAYSAVYKNYEKHWNAKWLLDDLEKIHPQFYPEPLFPPSITAGTPRHLHFKLRKSGFLTRREFVSLYDECSGFLHTRNPFASRAPAKFSKTPLYWIERFERLLQFHYFRLSGLPQLWVAEFHAADGWAHVHIANPT